MKSPKGRSLDLPTTLWLVALLAVGTVAILLGWHARGGVANPAGLSAHRLSPTAVTVDAGILVFREGLETILVLAAVTAAMRNDGRPLRRPVAIGGLLALLAGVATWFGVVWLLGRIHAAEYAVQAATGLVALLVLLAVMNWFFHDLYWTGWISHHHRRRRRLLGREGKAVWLGLVGLGFSSVYRECFEVVLFLQNLRQLYGSPLVLRGVALGLLFTAAAGLLTFHLHARLPYRRLLIATGLLLLLVLAVSVGEEVAELQEAHWLATTPIPGFHPPGWTATWFSLFPNYQTVVGQGLSVLIVLGSYLAAGPLKRLYRRRLAEQAACKGKEPAELAPLLGGEDP